MTCGDGASRGGTDTSGRLAAVEEPDVERREPEHAPVRALLSEYIEDTLAPESRERVAQHLDRCRACRVFLRTLERTIDLTRELPEHRMPDEQKRAILDLLASAAERSGVGRD